MAWKGESRRHSLARKGVKTNIDQDRRFDVSTFVAKGKWDLKKSTIHEVERMKKGGMKQVSKEELIETLDELGYKISKADTFNYDNLNSPPNPLPYKAKSLSIVEKDTGLSFANINAKKDKNYVRLQKLRWDTFVFDSGRIWEL